MQLKPICKTLAAAVGAALTEKEYTLSTAESCTGGLIGAAVTAVSGSSHWFKGGIIAYDNAVKKGLLHVSDDLLNRYGAVSEQTAAAMVQGVTALLDTRCGIAVTGIAGPGGGSSEKPVGLVYIAVRCNETLAAYKNLFHGNRDAVRQQTVEKSLSCLLDMINLNHQKYPPFCKSNS